MVKMRIEGHSERKHLRISKNLVTALFTYAKMLRSLFPADDII